MKCPVLVTVLMLPTLAFGASQPAPMPGDLAFSTINADEDGFALVTFVDLFAGALLKVTDNEWNKLPLGGGGALTGGEGALAWTLDADLPAGSVVRFSSVDSSVNVGVSHGAVARSGRFSLSTSNESLMLYREVAGDVLPIAAIGYGNSFASEISGAGIDDSALALSGDVDFAEYVGPRSNAATLGAYRSSVFDATNWLVRKSTDEAGTLPDLTSFSTMAAPVPEPATYSMLLAGLGLMSVVARRRSRA